MPITPARERVIHQMAEGMEVEIHRMADQLGTMLTQLQFMHRLTGPIPPEAGPPDVSRETNPYPGEPAPHGPDPGPQPRQGPPFPDVAWPGPGSDPAADASGFVTGPDR